MTALLIAALLAHHNPDGGRVEGITGWHVNPVPIMVVVDDDAFPYNGPVSKAFRECTHWWNDRVGFPVFGLAEQGAITVVLGVDADDLGDHVVMATQFSYVGSEVVGALVLVPTDIMGRHPLETVKRGACHELGHVLLLGHDADPGSIMHATTEPLGPYYVQPFDLDMLRHWYQPPTGQVVVLHP